MKLAVAVLPNGTVNKYLGRAEKIAVATIENEQITSWEEIDVAFTGQHEHHHEHDHHDHHDDHHHHGQGHNHHAVVDGLTKFFNEHNVDVVFTDHFGQGIKMVTERIDIKVITGAAGNAKEAVKDLINQGLLK